MADRIGQQLGNYRLVALLGQGSYAQVYLGQHVRLSLQAAIKVLHAHLTQAEAEHFYQEAETIAKLTYPSIVRILDFDVQDGVPFLVMDYAQGGSLRQRHPKGNLVPVPVIISSVKQVTAALQYAHDKKYIHRDIKPENMLIGQHQEVLLSDFGIATIAHSTSSLKAGAEGTSGTLAYMAPEQIEGHPRPASDQYALGIVVYEWLCGQRPFEGSVSELIAQQVSMPPPPLRERVPEIPLEVEQTVLRALAKDSKARFASVADFSTALVEASKRDVSGQTLPLLASGYATEAERRPSSLHGFPPLKMLDALPNNLPVQPTLLIGREHEVAAVGHLLQHEEIRLVTLTGPGGMGKTRLGLQVAAEASEKFPDGTWFVSLAPLNNPDLVIPTIAETLSVREVAARSQLEHLKAALRTRHMLLLLDNFEHVVSAATQVADLLGACPRLKVLVTSREALHVQAEREFPVPALALPDPKHLPSLSTLSQYEAVALFIERAQAIKPDFQVNNANAPAVAEICARLDGLPLAIELAAARTRLLPPQALLKRLGQRLQLLNSSVRDAPARQQTLRKTIQWSYDLLPAVEQRLFRWLSIFVNGCTLEAIECVSATLEDTMPVGLDEVASLLNKNLLQQTAQEEEVPRFTMLETIREYALEALASSEEMEDTRRAHAAYYLGLAEEAEPELIGPQQVLWLKQLEEEHSNLRAAIEWSLEPGEEGSRREMALRLGGALRRFWIVRGHWSEGRNFLEWALAESKGVSASVQAKALIAAANLADHQGENDRAEALAEQSRALYQELGDTQGIALSLRQLAGVAERRGNLVAVRMLNEEALALFRKVGDKEGAAWSLYNLGWLVIVQGEYAKARALLEESLALHREMGYKSGMAHSLLALASALLDSEGDPATIRALLEESLALSREIGDKGGIETFFLFSGQLALSQGDIATARSLAEKSLLINREIGNREDTTESLFLLARVEARQGNYAAARALYEQSLAIALEGNSKHDIDLFLQGFAEVVAVQGEPAWAARLYGADEAFRDANSIPIVPVYRTEYERSVAATRAQLGEQAFAAVWAEGRAMTPEQALAAQGPVTLFAAPPVGTSTTSPVPKVPAYPDGLTSREVEVLRLVAQGMTNGQVAVKLIISPRTVNTHLASIFSKIGVSSRSAATRYAIEQHLL
jgi:predicted ATPase/serine/threonine protein kinase/DNA-binding CsgD family transcriptional regulator